METLNIHEQDYLVVLVANLRITKTQMTCSRYKQSSNPLIELSLHHWDFLFLQPVPLKCGGVSAIFLLTIVPYTTYMTFCHIC